MKRKSTAPAKRITPAWLTPARRKRLYQIGAAGSAVLVGYGVITAEHALLWLTFAAAGFGIAQDNV